MHHTGNGLTLATALTAALGIAMATPAAAAPAPSAQEAYLHPLLTRYSTLSRDELLTEANKVCAMVHRGQSASAAVPMVEHDLNVSVPAAIDIVVGAAVYLNC